MPEYADTRIYLLLAELFLDSELTPDDARILADAIRSTKFTIDDIEHKIRAHLFPVLCPNILSPTGQWAGFDEEWLLHEVENSRRKEGNYLYNMWNYIWWHVYGGAVMSRWEFVKEYLQRPAANQSLKQQNGNAIKPFVDVDPRSETLT